MRERGRLIGRQVFQEEERERSIAAFREELVFDGEENLYPREYLIDDLLPEEGLGELFGESDVGKTFLSLSWAVSVAGCMTWFGRPVKSGTVLFIQAEGGRDFAVRKHAAKGAAGLGDGTEQLTSMRLPFITIYRPLGFGPDTDVAFAIARAVKIRETVKERGLPPIRFVVIDTLSQNMEGDIDSNAETQAFLRVLRAFLKALSEEPVFGLLIHHPGNENKSRGRGAYAVRADLDLIMNLKGKRDALTLFCDRDRSGDKFKPIHLRLEPRLITIHGEPLRNSRGAQQTSLVVAKREVAPAEKEPEVDPVRAAVLASLPEYPAKVGLQSDLVPKVGALVGHAVGKATIARFCEELKQEGLAESARGRQAGSSVWGKAERVAEPEEEPDEATC